MKRKKDNIKFPFPKPPAPGEIIEIETGIFWARMPLPMLIDHVNVYILEGVDSLTIIDTGLNVGLCRRSWMNILKSFFKGKTVKKVLITHHHPDHIGLLGWFMENYSLKVLCSRTSWLLARMLYFDKQDKPTAQAVEFWRKAGMDKETLELKLSEKPFNFSDGVAYFPLGFEALSNGQTINLGGKEWKVQFGQGHAPDHITLWGLDRKIVFSGDQIIPGISSNLGVYPTEPFLDTVGAWMETCARFKEMASSDHLVLPGHKLPFTGLKERLSQLIENHSQVLGRIEKFLSNNPSTAVELFEPIFRRSIKTSEYGLALAEAVGHINYFRVRNRLLWRTRSDGAVLYSLR